MRATYAAMVSLALLTAGCQMTTPFGPIGTPPTPTAGPTYFGGNGSQLYPPSDDFVGRTKEAMDDLGLSQVTERREGIKTLLEARTVNGRKAHIEMKPESGNVRVYARFGPFGDEALSRAFLDRMASRHGTVEAESKSDPVDVSKALSDSPKENRRAPHAPTYIDRTADSGYRDSTLP